MSKTTFFIVLIMMSVLVCLYSGHDCKADMPAPQAPASYSWLPHGYGQTMWTHSLPRYGSEGLHGFRTTPEHIGSWSYPLWGWDVNGYYKGPNVPCPDPGICQLPIGLIYPANGPVAPPPSPVRKVSAGPQ
jgi:hypothetical protein